jgi:hypothetical protein
MQNPLTDNRRKVRKVTLQPFCLDEYSVKKTLSTSPDSYTVKKLKISAFSMCY